MTNKQWAFVKILSKKFEKKHWAAVQKRHVNVNKGCY